MKSLYLALTLFLALLVAANPVPNPTADPDPDPVAIQFYGASLTGIPLKRRGEEEPAVLVKRTQSPTSGEHANKCGPNNQVGGVSYTCGAGNAGPCCSINVSHFVIPPHGGCIILMNGVIGVVRGEQLLLWRWLPGRFRILRDPVLAADV